MNDPFKEILPTIQKLESIFSAIKLHIEEIESRERVLEDGERQLAIKKSEQNRIDGKTSEKTLQLDQSEAYLKREATRLGKERQLIEYDKKQLADITKEKLELEVKRDEITKHNEALTKRIEELSGLVAKETALQQQEAVIEKEKVVDRERKRILDIRTKKIHEREEQLQLDHEIAEI